MSYLIRKDDSRFAIRTIHDALAHQAAVALIGPRQFGKTALALQLAENGPSLYLDLESRDDRDPLSDAALFLTVGSFCLPKKDCLR